MKRKVKRVDDCEVIVRIPKRLLVDYVREPVCFNQPRSCTRRYVDCLFHMAVFDAYLKLNTGGDVDDS